MNCFNSARSFRWADWKIGKVIIENGWYNLKVMAKPWWTIVFYGLVADKTKSADNLPDQLVKASFNNGWAFAILMYWSNQPRNIFVEGRIGRIYEIDKDFMGIIPW